MAVKEKILLNVCCSNCATHSINTLRDEGYEVVTWFYNPNIHPEEEYKKRFSDMARLAAETKTENITEVPYEVEEWDRACAGLENEPEGGKRCVECFRLRMEKTAQKTKELGFNIFAVTLTISPHKNAELINKLGREAAEKYRVKYFESNFKKKDGYKKSLELSRKHSLYRQNYCGCRYSKNDPGSKIQNPKAEGPKYPNMNHE